MGKLNVGKVIAGGLLAGLVLNTFDFVDFLQFSVPSAADIIRDFLLGVVLVWWYAAIRPRFNAGPKTALIAGTGVWLTIEIAFLSVGLGLSSMASFARNSIVPLITVNIASVAGAWVYRE